MPFTFAHPAIVLPLTRVRSAYISVSCLVAGSIAPDFEYFIRMKATGHFSHSMYGAFLFDLPLSIVIVVMFHTWLKRPVIDNLPVYFSSRLARLRNLNFLENVRHYYPGYLLCLIVGIFSHIFWDSFTHAGAFFVSGNEMLLHTVKIAGLPELPVYRYIQHVSSLAGLLVIGYYIHVEPTGRVKVPANRRIFWGVTFVVALSIFLVRRSMGFEYFADIGATIISSVLIGIALSSILYAIHQRKPDMY